jgi:phosphate:Na+ symporter
MLNAIMKKTQLPVILTLLVFGFWFSPDFQEIAAGVAIFLFGMLMLEDGFNQFGGGFLEQVLERVTGSMARSLGFGIVTTTIMQSSSLVSVITISFLSAGLLSLGAAIGIIFGANIGTTTGAWLIAGFGLKVNMSTYALPMLALGIVLVFQHAKHLRGIGYVLAGLGFLFLGIHYMKMGFDTFKDQFDLTRFAMTGFAGLIVYTLVGAAATVVMQSSHATMVLIITALAAGQISYENALALAIGANIGTTITAILGAMTANFQGKRLALAHLVFNVVTAGVALILISPLRIAVDWVSNAVGIAADDYALKLAVFHTIFNVIGVALMIPMTRRLILFLERTISELSPDVSRPRYLNDAVGAFAATAETALRNEVGHLNDNAIELIAHGLNLQRHQLYTAPDIEAYVKSARRPTDFDIEEAYEQRIKVLYGAILDFVNTKSVDDMPSQTIERMYMLREAAEQMVSAVKEVKHMRANTSRYTARNHGEATKLYNTLRTELGRILVEIHKLDQEAPENRSSLWLEEERGRVKRDRKATNLLVQKLMRKGALSPAAATSFLNDASYAYRAMKDLLEAARIFYSETEGALVEVERLLSLDEDDVELADSG